MEKLQAIPGTNDLLPAETARWDRLRRLVEDLMARYGYGRIETPHFEAAELFARGVGGTSDIVQKEMYVFEDQGGRQLALRPEGTAGVVRAYIQMRLDKQRPLTKLWYWGPMFRSERPQKGRYRQFWQFGVEALGSAQAEIDAEQVILGARIATAAGLSGLQLKLNSIGDDTCRPAYRERLQAFLRGVQDRLCDDCRRRLDMNPLRILDCKEESCREATAEAPVMLDSLCAPCAEHFAAVRNLLDRAGISYEVDGRLVRGLDYYQRTAFEFVSPELGAQSAVLGGGRYDGLVELLGGPSIPGVGWAAGIERFLMAAREPEEAEAPLDVFVAAFPETRGAAFDLVEKLRGAELSAELDFLDRGMKAQMKEAARSGARVAVIIGPDEWNRGAVTLRDLEAGRQEEIPVENLVEAVRRG